MLLKRPCPPGKSVKERTLNHTPPSCTFIEAPQCSSCTPQTSGKRLSSCAHYSTTYFVAILAYCLREQTSLSAF